MTTPSQIANPMVDYLNSLRTQQQDSNATYIHEARHEFVSELRQRAPWFPDEKQLYVGTKLDLLAADLKSRRIELRLLFLTGDAGDGKTAFCANLARQLDHEDDLRWETEIGPFRIIKDASEVDEAILSDRILEQLRPSPTRTLVVAINEGRLRRLFRSLAEPAQSLWRTVVEPALETSMDEAHALTLGEAVRSSGVMVINFRHRFHVRSVTPALLQVWTDANQWEASPACSTCTEKGRCPILANVLDLRTTSVQSGISDVLAWSHFSGQRLPFRRLQAVLALATTGGLRCNDVQGDALRNETALGLLRYRYYHAIFLRGDLHGPVTVQPEPIAQTFAGADPGYFVSPERDDEIQKSFGMTGPSSSDEGGNASWVLPALEQQAADELQQQLQPSTGFEDVAAIQEDLARLMRYLRRHAQFVDSVAGGLDWRQSLFLLEQYAAGQDSERKLTRTVVEAINRLHRVAEVMSETITGNQIDPAGLRVPSRQVLELSFGTEFDVRADCGPKLPPLLDAYLESTPSEIYLAAWPAGHTSEPAKLRLDSRLIGALLSVLRGYTSWYSLGPYRRDLARFHGRLMALAVERGRSPTLAIRIGEKRYGVTVEKGADRSRLRFEGRG